MKRKERDLTKFYDENLFTNRKFNNQSQKNKNATKNFDYRTIAKRLRTLSLSNNSNPTGVVKPVYGNQTFQLTAKAVYSKGHTFKNL